MDREELPIIFRAERSGDFKGEVTAVFPTMPFDIEGRYVTTYARNGQHGSGDEGWYARTRAATAVEYASLLRELRGIYEKDDEAPVLLTVYERRTSAHRVAFLAQVRR